MDQPAHYLTIFKDITPKILILCKNHDFFVLCVKKTLQMCRDSIFATFLRPRFAILWKILQKYLQHNISGGISYEA